MEKATTKGFMTATDLAEYLVRQNVPFRQAHGIVGRAVAYCIENSRELTDLNLEELKEFSPVISVDVLEYLTTAGSVNSRTTAGGTGTAAVEQALVAAEADLGI
jgi:argininosuccinate lyase